MAHAASKKCAAVIVDTLPRLMHAIKAEMRKRRGEELSVPQFRALMVIRRHEGASLSLVAEHLGSTLSSTSKLIEGLVERRYVTRETTGADRRRVLLGLTTVGSTTLEAIRAEATAILAERLAIFSRDDCNQLAQAMQLLSGAIAPAMPEREAEHV